jgi:hypothetical protein
MDPLGFLGLLYDLLPATHWERRHTVTMWHCKYYATVLHYVIPTQFSTLQDDKMWMSSLVMNL